MAWSLLAHTGAQSTTTGDITTTAIDTTGADLLAVVLAWYQAVADPTLVDSASNSWTGRTKYRSTNRSVQVLYVQAPTTSATHTFTASTGGAGEYPTICISAWSGSVATPYEAENGATTSSATSLATGSASPTTTDLFITGCAQGGTSGSLTLSAGFTATETFIGTSFAVEGGMGYATSASAQSATWNFASNEAAVTIAAFKGTGGGATRGLFMTPPLSGAGIGGAFYRDPLQAPAQMVRHDRLFVPAWLGEAA